MIEINFVNFLTVGLMAIIFFAVVEAAKGKFMPKSTPVVGS